MGTRKRERDERPLPAGSGPGRGLQPRIVLGLLLAASFAGIWVTHWAAPLGDRIVAWLFVVSLGLLAGGWYWRVVLFDETAVGDEADRAFVRDRWRRVETVTVVAVTIAGAAYLASLVDGPGPGIGRVAVAAGVGATPVLWLLGRWSPVSEHGRRAARVRVLILLVAVGTLAGFAWVETGTTAADWAVRTGHVAAFSLWFGGAVWHNAVVLPAIRSRPGAREALKAQARRFRGHLPVVVPLLFLTGLYQVDRLLGLAVESLLGSSIGHLVGLKVLVLALLTGLVVAAVRRSG